MVTVSTLARANTEKLTLATACDRCGYVESGAATATFSPSPVARAVTLYTMPSGRVLTLCGHHAAEHGTILLATGATLTQDERAALTVKPESGF